MRPDPGDELERRRKQDAEYRLLSWSEAQRIEAAMPKWSEAVGAAGIAAGLGDPNRLTLALLVRDLGEACVVDLSKLSAIEPSVASRHLTRLRKAGLLRSRREGRLSLHSLTSDGEKLVGVVLAAWRSTKAGSRSQA